MAAPCPIQIDTRFVLVATEAVPGTPETMTKSDGIPVTGVEIATEAEEVDRSDVYTPSGTGKGTISTGRQWQFTITQELYGSDTYHRALLDACPLTRITTPSPIVSVYEPSSDICAGSGIDPCTIEVHEVGGNVYTASNCTGVVQITAEPGKRFRLQFTMTGTFTQPADAATVTGTLPAVPLPLLYKNSDIKFTPSGSTAVDLISCPSFTFETGQSAVNVPSACTPDGGGFSYVTNTGTPSLAFDATLGAKDSVSEVWATAVAGDDCDVDAILYDDASGTQFRIEMDAATLQDPEMGDTEGFIAASLTFSGGPYRFGWYDTVP